MPAARGAEPSGAQRPKRLGERPASGFPACPPRSDCTPGLLELGPPETAVIGGPESLLFDASRYGEYDQPKLITETESGRNRTRTVIGGVAFEEVPMGRVGYARVSTRDQDPIAQELELKVAGAERVFV